MVLIRKLKRKIIFYAKKLLGRIDYNQIDVRVINEDFINQLCDIEREQKKDLIDTVLKYNQERLGIEPDGERGFPGDSEYLSSGYTKDMLNRYLFAGRFFCKGMKVLDTCSGFGWGTFIVSHYSRNVFAIEINEKTVDFCKNTWGKKKIKWYLGDCLDFSFLKNKKFDCILAMETVEHFSKTDIEKYMLNMYSVLKKGGFLVGTTPMTVDPEKAKTLLRTNPYHMHIYAPLELKALLEKYFSTVRIIRSWMFVARK